MRRKVVEVREGGRKLLATNKSLVIIIIIIVTVQYGTTHY